jgi:hypothetical protein
LSFPLGTVVTLETFIAWKAKFDKDMAHIIFEEKNKAKEKTAGKLTGKNKEGKKLYSGLRKRKEGRQERKKRGENHC